MWDKIKLNTANGFIGRIVQVGRIIAQVPAIKGRYRGEVIVLIAGHHINLTKPFGFLDGLFRPLPGIHVIRCRFIGKQI